jgi:hypothetical protein
MSDIMKVLVFYISCMIFGYCLAQLLSSSAFAQPCNKRDPNLIAISNLRDKIKDSKLVVLRPETPWILVTQKQKNYYNMTGRLP